MWAGTTFTGMLCCPASAVTAGCVVLRWLWQQCLQHIVGGVSFCPAGARVQTTVSNLDRAVLGTCGRFEERQVGRSIEILHRQCFMLA